MFEVKESKSETELGAILQLRYKILREPWAQTFESARDEREEKSVNAFITNENGQIIACGRLQENENKVGQIRYMAVDETFRGRGLGKLILIFLENKAKEMGLNSIELQARENAVSFYESNGYIIKEKSFLLWGLIQHYLMEKGFRTG